MIVKQIKALLKNKSNFIYLILITVIFIILNIIPNLSSIIDNYYDSLLYNSLKEYAEIYGSFPTETAKTLLVSDNSTPISTLEELLKDVKYFNRIYVEPVDFGSNYIVDFVYIEVDDWKHCTYVKNYLDNNGIATSYNESEKFYTDYASASTYANIIKYFVIILSFVILTVSCANIIKNENKNLKLLSVIGYSKKNIRKITSIQILSILFAGCFIGIIISEVLIKILMNILDMPIHKDLILTISLDILMVLLPTFIMTRRKSDLKF